MFQYGDALFGLAPGEVYLAINVTIDAVRSYRTLSPLPTTVGGLLSAALSVSYLPRGYLAPCSVEPGLSSL